jgi:KaiC/GvpD/RAD55 family RecA-like ATPase
MGTVATTIAGFDRLIEGGFIENDLIIVSGGPGTGKTTFGIQYLYGGAMLLDEPGVLVTLDESPARIIRNMWRFGWDLEQLGREGKLKIVYVDPLSLVFDAARGGDELLVNRSSFYLQVERCTVEGLLRVIRESVKEIHAKRVFMDSITALRFSLNRLATRRVLLHVVRSLEAIPCTTLVSSELPFEDGEYGVEDYIAEGVIRLHLFRVGNDKVRAVEVLKMRGVHHDESLHPYSILEDGIVVYSSDSVILDEKVF